MKTLHVTLLALALAACAPPAYAAPAPDPAAVAVHETLHAAAAASALDAGPAIATSAPAPPAATAPALRDPEKDPVAYAQEIAKAASARNWPLLTVLVIVAAIALLRRFGERWIPWLRTDRGGATLALLFGFGTALTGIVGAGGVSWSTLLTGLGMTFLSAGAFAFVKKMFFSKKTSAPAGGP